MAITIDKFKGPLNHSHVAGDLPTVPPLDAQYLVLAANGTLTDERILTGTTNQVAVTDNGAGSTAVLSTPQDIHSAATPTFAGAALSSGTTTLGVTAGVIDAGGATSLEIPNSATPTVDAAGEIALDTTVTDHTGLLTYHDGVEALYAIAIPTGNLTATDGHVVAYNAANNEFEMVAPAVGGGGAPTGAQYLTLATDATLTAERVLTGTANQITVTDNGAGSTAVLSTPQNLHTAATVAFASVTAPLIVGGSGTTQTLTYKTTTGVGATGANHKFLVGNNGATEAATILNNGNVGVGTTLPGEKLTINGVLKLDGGVNDIGFFAPVGVTYGYQMSFNRHPLTGANQNTGIGGSSVNVGPSYLAFYTSSSGATGTNIQRMRVKNDGSVGIGGSMDQIEPNFVGAFVVIHSTGNVGIGTTTPTNFLSLNGTVARTIGMERHTISNTAGNDLAVKAGGATVSATDKNGGTLFLAPGISTGTGQSNVRIQGFTRGTTGTADNTLVDRLIVPGAVNLTDAATSMFEIALPAGAMTGGHIFWTIRASDGTDHQAYSGTSIWTAVNKAGVYSTDVTTPATTDSKSTSSGTISVSFGWLEGTDKVTMQCTPSGSLTETVYQLTYTVVHNSPRVITIL